MQGRCKAFASSSGGGICNCDGVGCLKSPQGGDGRWLRDINLTRYGFGFRRCVGDGFSVGSRVGVGSGGSSIVSGFLLSIIL